MFANGTRSIDPRMADKPIAGAIWKMKPVEVLNTEPFLNRIAISFTGWKRPGPFRPEAILFVRTINPGKKRAARAVKRIPAIIR